MIQKKGGVIVGQSIGKRIAAMRRERGYNQDQLAEKAGISRITLARYETDVIRPSAISLANIADALGVSADELLGRSEKLPPFIQMLKGAVPIVGDIACGTPITAEQNIDGFADLPEGVRADFALRCKGDSMTPTFQEGDIVLIRQQPEVEPGQIAAIGINGEAILKHVYTSGGNFLCVSDNPNYPPQIYKAEDAPTIYGLAVGFVRLF